LFEGFEAFDGGEYFHAVVGGEAVAAEKFTAVRGVEEDDAISARAGVWFGAAVGIDSDVLSVVGHGASRDASFFWNSGRRYLMKPRGQP